MIATAWNLLQRGWLVYTIHETERYLRACERDGLVHSLSLADFRAQLEAQRVQLALLQSRRPGATVPQRTDGAPMPAEACTDVGAEVVAFVLPRPTFLHALAWVAVIAGVAVFK